LDAITENEFNRIIEMRDDRNKISHELLDLLLNDFEVTMIENFTELINICKKIDKWCNVWQLASMRNVNRHNLWQQNL